MSQQLKVAPLDQGEIEAKVRELQSLQLQSVQLAISAALDRGDRFLELSPGNGVYQIFVDAVERAANAEPLVLDYRFHSYWSDGSGTLMRAEGGRVTIVLNKRESQ